MGIQEKSLIDRLFENEEYAHGLSTPITSMWQLRNRGVDVVYPKDQNFYLANIIQYPRKGCVIVDINGKQRYVEPIYAKDIYALYYSLKCGGLDARLIPPFNKPIDFALRQKSKKECFSGAYHRVPWGDEAFIICRESSSHWFMMKISKKDVPDWVHHFNSCGLGGWTIWQEDPDQEIIEPKK